MNVDRLRYLASRAADGALTISEQRECMKALGNAYLVCWGFELGTMPVRHDWKDLAQAASIPEQRKRCEMCGGEGGRVHILNGAPAATLPNADVAMSVCCACGGSGYTKESI